jgi:pimeloyl-ACP methyl ester carboxylesterase
MLEEAGDIRNVVLVHGGFVDASGWQGVYQLLRSRGFAVSVVQNPTTSLADDVAVVRRALAKLDGPAVLVGHSYGGAVITEAGTQPAVAALVYVAAFAPDAGESVATLIADPRDVDAVARGTGDRDCGRRGEARPSRTDRGCNAAFRLLSRHCAASSHEGHEGTRRTRRKSVMVGCTPTNHCFSSCPSCPSWLPLNAAGASDSHRRTG